MLKLENIVKNYIVGDNVTEALKGISMEFRDNEFVSILGPSGCGKTTLLNIIGGLDKYTSGDLIINGVSTKKYKDRDWDSYRNHKIGFVFQSYNLIPHQTVLANVELALTLSGVSRKERRARAVEALEKVGLKGQLNKKPNQMSGGQMQRVAIARALVNNPDILLADEPTGALDTETSAQVMDILAEVANNKLVIMVTHNPELAQIYSTRIIRLLDGKVISDTMPVTEDNVEEVEKNTSSEDKVNASSDTISYWNEQQHNEDKNSNSEESGNLNADNSDAQNESDKALGDESQNPASVSGKKSKKSSAKASKSEKQNRPPRTSMKSFTALSLSLNNLMTKKARTFLTAFAGSIGIIGIALILSLSNGVQKYIDRVEEDTLSSYPVIIEKKSIDITSFMSSMQHEVEDKEEHDLNKIYTNQIMTGFMELMLKQVSTNNLTDFMNYIRNNEDKFKPLTSDINYSYSTTMNIYRADTDSGLYQVNPGQVYSSIGMGGASGYSSMGMSSDVWQRLINNDELLKSQYEVVCGRMPEKYDEVVLLISENNEITDYTLYTLGILDNEELTNTFRKMVMGEKVNFPEAGSYDYDEFMNLRFKLLLNSDYFENIDGVWTDRSDDEMYILKKLENATELKVVGILRSDSDAAMSGMAGTIGYRTDLMEYLIAQVEASPIVREQKTNSDTDIFTGIKFDSGLYEDESMTWEELEQFMAVQSEENRAQYEASIEQMRGYGMSDEAILKTFNDAVNKQTTEATFEGNLRRMGYSDVNSPNSISIYPKDFESKDKITELIADYNNNANEEDRITYTDYVGLIMSSVTTIINAISYILIAFVAISLVVSSIMIGIITYISVLERTKEIGILRAIGASKKDISRVFNAETLIIGFTAGALGILISFLLLIPINAIIEHFTDITGLAVLPYEAALILVFISMALTFIAGLFPSRIAAKKDPVVALRTE